MKEFLKTPEGLFICEECQRTYIKKENLSRHIGIVHMSQKEYYDKWLKEEGDGLCKICSKETIFTGFYIGYKECCCKKHTDLYAHGQRKITMIKRFGVENVFQLQKTKEKSKQTKKERYGNENYRNDEKIKETCLQKFGVENPSQCDFIKNKKAQTFLLHYNVTFLSQDPSIFNEMCKKSFKLIKFKNTNIWYQGSYELDFLENYYNIFPDITRGLSFKYYLDQKTKIYHSDFYIPSLNLIIEIKNSYLANRFKNKIKQQKISCLLQGYKWFMIVDKHYTKFNNFIDKITV